MNARQNGFRGGWRRSAVLLIAAGVVLAVGVSGLFADGPDSTKQGLREGQFVARDTVKHPQSQVAMEALQRLNEKSVRKWSVDWNERTGLPDMMEGAVSASYPSDSVRAAKSFAEQYLDLFLGLRDTQLLAGYSLSVLRTTSRRDYIAVAFDEYYRGVKVYQAGFAVNVQRTGTIGSITNSLRPIQLDNMTPTLSNADAEEIIRRLAGTDSVDTRGNELELCIYPSAPPRLVYSGQRTIDGVPWNLIIDAHSGDILVANISGFVDQWRRGSPMPVNSAKDTIGGQFPLPMLPAQPMRPVQEPEKRGLERDSASKGKGGACNLGASARSHPVKVHSEPANPNSDCWFYDVNFLPGADVPRLSTQLVLESTGDSK